eukprot:gnl/TRDRNA2_/TRDRNA2_175319_c3_seq1.p1 gnl/TRDRNA2_/TRDRNA2_175319_c3~~gnl/TRDRNA2_/TRDRNA2_175319_c3_seq1.p1  ORF type:complete len:397 (-),score=81.11 gnl/TRDRNA2_/TRDRNA2_175319_c3_seq1:164-1354(-)
MGSVPSNEQFYELKDTVLTRRAQVEQICSTVSNRPETEMIKNELYELRELIEMKADTSRVLAIEQFREAERELSDTYGQKGDIEDLNRELRRLQATIARKVDESTMQEHLQDFRSVLLRKVPTNEQFLELLAMVGRKADATAVPTNEQEQALWDSLSVAPAGRHQLMTTIRTNDDASSKVQEQLHGLQASLRQKADVDRVPTIEQFHKLEDDMNERLRNLYAMRLLDETLGATKKELHDISATVAKKANADSVPTNQDFHELQGALETQADKDESATREQVQTLRSTMHKQADLEKKTTKDEFRELLTQTNEVRNEVLRKKQLLHQQQQLRHLVESKAYTDQLSKRRSTGRSEEDQLSIRKSHSLSRANESSDDNEASAQRAARYRRSLMNMTSEL